jgi:hypothetical protein
MHALHPCGKWITLYNTVGALNGITLGPRETDSYSRLILISEQTKHTLGRKW